MKTQRLGMAMRTRVAAPRRRKRSEWTRFLAIGDIRGYYFTM